MEIEHKTRVVNSFAALEKLLAQIESGRKAGKNMQADEVEFCYLQDEFYRRSRWNNRSRDRSRDRSRRNGRAAPRAERRARSGP